MKWAALALLAGCSDPEPPTRAVARAEPSPQPAPPDALDRWDVTPPDAGPKLPSICSELERAKIGAAIGATTPLFEVSQVHLGGPAWGTPGIRWCDWFEIVKGVSGRGISVELEDVRAFDTGVSIDPLVKSEPVAWRAIDALDTPALIGERHGGQVSLQTLAHEARIEVTVLAQLPADARPWIASKPAPR